MLYVMNDENDEDPQIIVNRNKENKDKNIVAAVSQMAAATEFVKPQKEG